LQIRIFGKIVKRCENSSLALLGADTAFSIGILGIPGDKALQIQQLFRNNSDCLINDERKKILKFCFVRAQEKESLE
jgi:hypothetical protein